jgi:hypothetical protein
VNERTQFIEANQKQSQKGRKSKKKTLQKKRNRTALTVPHSAPLTS